MHTRCIETQDWTDIAVIWAILSNLAEDVVADVHFPRLRGLAGEGVLQVAAMLGGVVDFGVDLHGCCRCRPAVATVEGWLSRSGKREKRYSDRDGAELSVSDSRSRVK